MGLYKKSENLQSNTEYLKHISPKNHNKALEVLELAKEQEKQKLNSGFHYVSDGIRAMKLKK